MELVLCLIGFLSVTAAATVGTGQQVPAEVVTLSGVRYAKEVLVDLKNKFPQDVRVDRRNGNIFFITAEAGFNAPMIGFSNYEPTFKAHVLKANTRTAQDIPGIRSEAKCIGIDQIHGGVYIGTEKGIYKFDDRTSSAFNYGSLPHDIISLDVGFNGTQIYYLEAALEKTHSVATDLSSHDVIYDLKGAYGLTFDQKNNVYFTDFYTPYVLRAGSKNRLRIIGDNEFFKVADYSVSPENVVYAIDDVSNLYRIDPDNVKAINIGNFGIKSETTSLAVDNNGDYLVGYKYGIARIKKV